MGEAKFLGKQGNRDNIGKTNFDASHLGENIDMCIFTVTTFRLIIMVFQYQH